MIHATTFQCAFISHQLTCNLIYHMKPKITVLSRKKNAKMNQLKHILNLNVDKYMHAQKLNRTEQKINENELKIKGKKGIEMREFSGGV